MLIRVVTTLLLVLPALASAGVMKCVGPGGQVTYAESCPGGKPVEIHDNSLPADGYRAYQAKQAEKAAAKAVAREQAAKAPKVFCSSPPVTVWGNGQVSVGAPICNVVQPK